MHILYITVLCFIDKLWLFFFFVTRYLCMYTCCIISKPSRKQMSENFSLNSDIVHNPLQKWLQNLILSVFSGHLKNLVKYEWLLF